MPSAGSTTSCSSAARSPTRGGRERWDSLRLLTPNWQSRLPGFGYDGDDPDGFRTMPETIEFIVRYAARDRGAGPHPHHCHFGQPSSMTATASTTDRGDWRCRTVVIATGACNIATVPAFAAEVPAGDRRR